MCGGFDAVYGVEGVGFGGEARGAGGGGGGGGGEEGVEVLEGMKERERVCDSTIPFPDALRDWTTGCQVSHQPMG